MSRSIYTHLRSAAGRTVPESDREARTGQAAVRVPWERPKLPANCDLENVSVAVVGGGMAGLAAAKWLTNYSTAAVTLFEARPEVGGRVRSNTTFSPGRITEEGAELLGSFHQFWKRLAFEYGLTWFGRMDGEDYAGAGLTLRMSLDKLLSGPEIDEIEKALRARILRPMATLARGIKDPSRPWNQPLLEKFDKMSVADALLMLKVKKGTRLWKSMELLVQNNYLAPIDEVNFLGLLCLLRGAQLNHQHGNRMAYWDELEIFRCADGCQALATKMEEEIGRTQQQGRLKRPRIEKKTMVTGIKIKKDGVSLNLTKLPGWPVTWPVDMKAFKTEDFDYVILAIPPSVWSALAMDPHPKDAIGLMGMGHSTKFFSNMTHRFWIKDKAAPNGGSLKLGLVWEGTDNQTRVRTSWKGKEVDQGIVLSVYTGSQQLDDKTYRDRLTDLYPNYKQSLIAEPNPHGLKQTLLVDWSKEPFIGAGFVAIKKGQIFKIGQQLVKPFHDRMFFAGEHTQMDFFGYMEGALRSGARAADDLMQHACRRDTKPTVKPPVRVARVAEAPEQPEFLVAVTEAEEDMESPFVNQELFATPPVQDSELRAAALAGESPFLQFAVEGLVETEEAELEPGEAELEIEGLETYADAQALISEEGPVAGEEEEDEEESPFAGEDEDESRPDESMELLHEEHESPSDEALEGDETDASLSAEALDTEEQFEDGDSWSDEAAAGVNEVERELENEDELDGRHRADLVESGEIDPELVDELEDAEHDPSHEAPSLEMFVPAVSQADLRTRIDEYLDLANATYTLPDGGGTVRARPQFRFAKLGGMQEAIRRVSGILGKPFEKAHPRAIHMAAYGRAKPSDITFITQGLIDAGEFKKLKDANTSATNEELVRMVQREFKMGIDCAGYVQLAFIHAYRGSDDDSPSIRRSLGLHEKRGWEKLASLPRRHFTKVNVTDGRTGDLFVLRPRADARDRAWHTVIIVAHTVAGTVHTFVCDASWGTDLYGVNAGGVARRELKHDTANREWWDVHPLTGAEANRNSIGPYNGHRIHGMFRPNEQK